MSEQARRQKVALPHLVVWFLFGQGGLVAALFLPVHVLVQGILAPLGLVHAVAPASASGCMDSLRRAHTTIAWPAFMTFNACGRPMIPNPTNPAFIFVPQFKLC